MKRITSILGFLAAVFVCPHTQADDEPSTSSDRIVIRHSVTDYERSSLLGSATFGILQDCYVRIGDRVKEKQVLGRLYNKDVQAEMELYQAKSQSDLAVRLSEAKLAQALAKLKASNSLHAKNMVSGEEYTLHQLAATTCELELAEAKFDLKLDEIRRRQAEAVVLSREIVSPHDGIVVAMFRRQNETVAPTEPAFQIVDTSRVRVTGLMDVSNAWRVKVGQAVQVRPEIGGIDLPIENQTFEGHVVFVDPIIDKKKQTCRVVAEVANQRDQFLAGLETRMEIFPDNAASGGSESLPTVGEGSKSRPATEAIPSMSLKAPTRK